jgi:hypothetical protein
MSSVTGTGITYKPLVYEQRNVNVEAEPSEIWSLVEVPSQWAASEWGASHSTEWPAIGRYLGSRAAFSSMSLSTSIVRGSIINQEDSRTSRSELAHTRATQLCSLLWPHEPGIFLISHYPAFKWGLFDDRLHRAINITQASFGTDQNHLFWLLETVADAEPCL